MGEDLVQKKQRSKEALIERLGVLGVGGVLKELATNGQILELRCEMPKCYCPKGRAHFDPKGHPPGKWAPSPDHYPMLKSYGGQLKSWNVRVAHILCNREDYGWRMRITTLLQKGKSLEEIAEELNRKGITPPHGHNKWSPASVRKAFVS